MKTVKIHVPAIITLTLPYHPSSGFVWQLASGGAQFSMAGPAVFQNPGSGATLGNEIFRFSMKAKGKLPLVIDYLKPGPISGSPRQFVATLDGV
jgi:predicted secreted protein